MDITHDSVLLLIKIASAIFTAILMLQSGLDKVFNYAGNKEWLTEFFAKSPLNGTVSALLPILTILELAAGGFSAVGAVLLLVNKENQTAAFLGILFATASFICLFFGQRLAKDYASAVNMTVYFIFSLFGLLVYSM
ncbi:MAG: hypothetical protein RI894_1924 [Bacteroidota bacterium]